MASLECYACPQPATVPPSGESYPTATQTRTSETSLLFTGQRTPRIFQRLEARMYRYIYQGKARSRERKPEVAPRGEPRPTTPCYKSNEETHVREATPRTCEAAQRAWPRPFPDPRLLPRGATRESSAVHIAPKSWKNPNNIQPYIATGIRPYPRPNPHRWRPTHEATWCFPPGQDFPSSPSSSKKNKYYIHGQSG